MPSLSPTMSQARAAPRPSPCAAARTAPAHVPCAAANQGNIAKWHKKEGDKVAAGDVLADIETDKARLRLRRAGAEGAR